MAFEAGSYQTCVNCNGFVAQPSSQPSGHSELIKLKPAGDVFLDQTQKNESKADAPRASYDNTLLGLNCSCS